MDEPAMHLAVCCKGIPRDGERFSIAPDHTRLVHESAAFFLNESDEYALDEAIKWKKKIGAEVTAISLGGLESQEILYLALAKGADEALRIDSPAAGAWETATFLAKATEVNRFDIALVGVQSADQMASLVGGLMAATLGWPFVFAVNSLEIAAGGSTVAVQRELGQGKLQQIEVELPVVLAVQTGICPLTYTPAARRLKARQKTIQVMKPEQLGFAQEWPKEYPKEKIEEMMAPVATRSATMLQGDSQDMVTLVLERIRQAT